MAVKCKALGRSTFLPECMHWRENMLHPERCSVFWFSMQNSELSLFAFDFHFKDFFMTGIVIRLITLSDFDLYSYVLITTMIRRLRWSCMILDWINHAYKDSPRNFKRQWFMDQSLSHVEKAGSSAGMASVISALPLYIVICQSICSNV